MSGRPTCPSCWTCASWSAWLCWSILWNPGPARLKRLVLACEAAGASKVFGYANSPRDLHTERCPCTAEMLTVGEGQTWRV